MARDSNTVQVLLGMDFQVIGVQISGPQNRETHWEGLTHSFQDPHLPWPAAAAVDRAMWPGTAGRAR